jgi:hypothetical protein
MSDFSVGRSPATDPSGMPAADMHGLRQMPGSLLTDSPSAKPKPLGEPREIQSGPVPRGGSEEGASRRCNAAKMGMFRLESPEVAPRR